jgi:hypothetical protein
MKQLRVERTEQRILNIFCMSLWAGIQLPYVAMSLSVPAIMSIIQSSNVGQLKGKGHVARHKRIRVNGRAAPLIINLGLEGGNDEFQATSSLPVGKTAPGIHYISVLLAPGPV